ncbi:hypothetical protein EYF80_056290 [Liparis tanakae]|uniref:Uncharacterized protein n=1 Tax=Liparis tanakae TaxID=230148 RepID=A0A4Z2EX59_9TELE|nr:hypothetical protein EYF80_056290 [Liparis tanakae]
MLTDGMTFMKLGVRPRCLCDVEAGNHSEPTLGFQPVKDTGTRGHRDTAPVSLCPSSADTITTWSHGKSRSLDPRGAVHIVLHIDVHSTHTMDPASHSYTDMRSSESGLENAPLCATSRPASTCFTATSTFLPLMVYCGGGRGEEEKELSFKPERTFYTWQDNVTGVFTSEWYSYVSYWNVTGLQQQRRDVFGRQSFPNGSFNLRHQLRTEGPTGRHLQEQNDSLLSLGVVLRHAKAVRHFLERLHCKEGSNGKRVEWRTQEGVMMRTEGRRGKDGAFSEKIGGGDASTACSWHRELGNEGLKSMRKTYGEKKTHSEVNTSHFGSDR